MDIFGEALSLPSFVFIVFLLENDQKKKETLNCPEEKEINKANSHFKMTMISLIGSVNGDGG